jgi:hypothetical protein
MYSEYPISAKPTEAPKTLNAAPGALAGRNPDEANNDGMGIGGAYGRI